MTDQNEIADQTGTNINAQSFHGDTPQILNLQKYLLKMHILSLPGDII